MQTKIPNLDNPIEYSAHYEDTRNKVGHKKFDRLSWKKQQDEIDLNFLAKILVQAYFDAKELESRKGQDTTHAEVSRKS